MIGKVIRILLSNTAALLDESTYREQFRSLGHLFGFLVWGMLATEPAIFTKLQFIRSRAFILGCRIVSSFAFSACKGNNDSHLKNSLSTFIR